MSRGSFSTSNYLSRSDVDITAPPISMFAWVYCTDLTNYLWIISLGNNGSNGHFSLVKNDNANGNLIGARIQSDAGTLITAYTASGMSVNTWTAVGAVFTATNSRAGVLSGTVGTPETTDVASPTVDYQSIGVLRRNATSSPWTGYIAEAAIWNVALSSADWVSLAAGCSPADIQPSYLKRHWSLIETSGNAMDTSGHGCTLHEIGTVPYAETHPTIHRAVQWHTGQVQFRRSVEVIAY